MPQLMILQENREMRSLKSWLSATKAMAAADPTANAEGWSASQSYELQFWKNAWPYRNLPMREMQELRHRDAMWLLDNLGFQAAESVASPSAAAASAKVYPEFCGTVLEVGCGPIGFFELVDGIECTATDSLMAAYAREIDYSTLGSRGNSTYVDQGLESITDTFDFVVCSNVLDHTADWLAFLELLADRVHERGELLLMTDTRGRPVAGHTQVFTSDQLLRAIRWIGFRRIKFQKVVASQDGHCDWKVFLRASRS